MAYLSHNVGARRVNDRGGRWAISGKGSDDLGGVLDCTIGPQMGSRCTGREGERSSDV